MRTHPGRHSFVYVVAALVPIFIPVFAAAQKSEEIVFDSADKVELRGTFYPSAKGKAAPCVILLHKYGGNRQQKGWEELAQALQAEFAVLSFDFRGHGDSTGVGPEFWRGPNASYNYMIHGASRAGSKISFKDFPPAYMPMLANDVAAAKHYLDGKNDAGACNSSNLVVIGAEEGAAIGALWIAWEFSHVHQVKNAFGMWTRDPQGRIEGEDIMAAVWLSIPAHLSGAYVGNWFRSSPAMLKMRIRDRVPMVFFFGEKDGKAAQAAGLLLNELRRGGREKLELTRERGKPTKLAGNELLAGSLDTKDEIITYLKNVIEKRGIKSSHQRDIENGPPLTLIPLGLFVPR